ncbi:MAG TPA: PEP-CTERM/exosortase system-associated acyltransferase [Casimicrobiaceae bacterium]|jgi:N-acyl amino acid synthase of PEP-CTERM/exosortase system|nr:PEP-CTERM/exosortase system-associated acyltransferase [Casimicrobiaceae bacterium]
MSFSTIDLASQFSTYFEIVRATSRDLREASFKVRHRVYCEELGFESPRADAMECDEYDGDAEHILIRSRRTLTFVGCARVVRPQPVEHALPVERSGAWKASPPLHDVDGNPRIAELSRLAVVSEFRRRRGEQNSPVNLAEADFGTPVQPRFPHIPVGLYLGALALAARKRIATLVVLTEERLARHFGRMGVHLDQCGEPVEFHGLRAPYVMNVEAIVERLPADVRPLYDMIGADLQ